MHFGPTNREAAYDKKWGKEDGEWSGENPLTGKYKDNSGQIYGSQDESNAQNYADNVIAQSFRAGGNAQAPTHQTGMGNKPQNVSNYAIPDFLRTQQVQNNPVAAPSRASMLRARKPYPLK
jgi:hypothetical protein